MAQRPDDNLTDPNAVLGQNIAKRIDATSAYKRMLDQRGNALLSVNEKSGPRSKAYIALEHRLRLDDEELERIKNVVRRPISRWSVRPAVLLIVAIGLAMLEAPANKFLFDVALQSSGFVSYAVSAGVTAFLLFLAHFAGRSIRQVWSDYRGKVIWSFIAVFLICLFASGMIVSVLTVARAAFATQGGTIGDLLSGIQGNFADLGPIGALSAALSDTSALVLACINVGGIVTTFILAFSSHDSDRDFDHAQNSVDRDEKAMARVHNAYLGARARIIAQFAPDLVGYAANYSSANSRVVELKTRLRLPLDDTDHFVLTDLDQMSEDAERAGQGDEVAPGSGQTITSMSDYRRQTGTEGP